MPFTTTDITGQIEGCPFPQWYLEQGNPAGIWTSEEVARIDAVLRPQMQEFTDKFGGYADNFWRICKFTYGDESTFMAWKITWQNSSYGGHSIEEIAQKIEAYYSN